MGQDGACRPITSRVLVLVMSSETMQDKVARFLFQRSFKRRECSHLEETTVTEYDGTTCVGCAEEGTKTVHLRMCLVSACGLNSDLRTP